MEASLLGHRVGARPAPAAGGSEGAGGAPSADGDDVDMEVVVAGLGVVDEFISSKSGEELAKLGGCSDVVNRALVQRVAQSLAIKPRVWVAQDITMGAWRVGIGCYWIP